MRKKVFSDLPFELRLSILKTARIGAFKEKIQEFETIFENAINSWRKKKLDDDPSNENYYLYNHTKSRVLYGVMYSKQNTGCTWLVYNYSTADFEYIGSAYTKWTFVKATPPSYTFHHWRPDFV